MKVFGVMYNVIFVVLMFYVYDFYVDKIVVEIGCVENVMEEYYVIFVEWMI